MPQDIFISYSSKDKEKADQLTELLTSAGLSVWIDRAGIGAATSWSEEIVNALDECKAFVVMLSPASVDSKNVVREVALAFEKNKKILPLDLEPVQLPASMQYHLAGLQRTSMTNIDSIIRALGNLGLEATQAPSLKLVKETDSRKSLMILPFQDLSPTGDNGWFADGIVSELIQALSNVKALLITDAQTTKDFKRYQGTLPNYAKEMQVRYFVEGDVRKIGDQIKVNSRLLDIETGDHLWQDSMKGTMNDIFDIQEKVAEKVVDGLKVHLASDEKQKLAERGTENAEAYELYLKASEYFHRHTKEGILLAIQLLTEAVKLDTGYAQASNFKAIALAMLYRGYDRTPALLDEAETLCKGVLRMKPDLFTVYYPLSQVYMHRGQLAEAEEAARQFIRKDPQNYNSHFTLGFFYENTGQPAKAIAPYEESVRLKPDNLVNLFNLVANCDAAGEREKCRHWAQVALPQVERYLKLHPDDESKRVKHALLLFHSGRTDDARVAAMKLTNLKDGAPLYNTACLFGHLGDKVESLRTFRKSIEAGFRSMRHLKEFLTEENEGVLALQGTPEYEEAKTLVEKIETESAKETKTNV
ncbi:MAG: TIR domain-containing protein [Bacteroidota bacterium]|nr:TIR domain-containing protein [Bacteroidota bacterium]